MTASTTARVRDDHGWLTASEINRRDRAHQDAQVLRFSCSEPDCMMEPFDAPAAVGRRRMVEHRAAGHTTAASLVQSLDAIVARHVRKHKLPGDRGFVAAGPGENADDAARTAGEVELTPVPSPVRGSLESSSPGGRAAAGPLPAPAAARRNPRSRCPVLGRLRAAHAGVTVAAGFDLDEHLARVADVVRRCTG